MPVQLDGILFPIPSTAINQLEMWQEDTFDEGR
jgi:hypothetical protein